MIKFRYPLISIFLVLIVNFIAVYKDYYHSIAVFDIPMHFFGGFAIALLAMSLYGFLVKFLTIKTKTLVKSKVPFMVFQAIFVIGFVMIIGVAWEWYEFLFDHFSTAMVQKYGLAQMGIADTMDDLVNDALGAAVAFIALWDLM